VFTQFPVREDVSDPDQRAECLLSPLSARMSPSDLGVFGLDKRAAAVDETTAAIQRQTTLLQQDDWVKAVVHTECVHYDSCTGQHKVVNKGVSGRYGVVICLTSDATSMCVGADQSTCL